MNDKLNIPKRIKVGFNNRTDTYTGKLAYIVYFDDKGVLRKEKSLNNWRDKQIDTIEFDNVPSQGFVLNRNVGGVGASYGWNARHEYVRVYDPRGFEFEINIANLLFILQECSSIKGKGLEGEFIYAWNKDRLVLLPTSCQEYSKSVSFTSIQSLRVKKSDMKEGFLYRNKQNNSVVYLGRHTIYYKYPWSTNHKEFDIKDRALYKIAPQICHLFFNFDEQKYWFQSGFTNIATVEGECHPDTYAEKMEQLKINGFLSKPVFFEYTSTNIDKTQRMFYFIEPLDKYSFRKTRCYCSNNRFSYANQSKNVFLDNGIVKEKSIMTPRHIENLKYCRNLSKPSIGDMINNENYIVNIVCEDGIKYSVGE